LEFKNWVLKKGVQELELKKGVQELGIEKRSSRIGVEKRYSKFQCTFLVHALYIPCT
jgi:hypothetical protein